mmetsp:Transcript_27899/g.88668  ORF Transcript_27899/g.88668 Transcript_27899/m.88668 type:complete len:163 (+) Transcript_27899:60-548(+)
MAAWKEKPRRFVEPPMVTSQECLTQKQAVSKEIAHSQMVATKIVAQLGSDVLERPNEYLAYFKKEGSEPLAKGPQYSVDRVMQGTTFDKHTPRDTCHPLNTEAARRRCKVPFQTARQVRTSQAYGWLPPIDEPNHGLGRSPILLNSSMDKSHLGGGGPWTAR